MVSEPSTSVFSVQPTAERLVVVEVLVFDRPAPVGEREVVANFQRIQEVAAVQLEPDLLLRKELVGDHERLLDADDRGRAVVHVPNAVRRQELADLQLEQAIELVLDVDALDANAAPANRLFEPGVVEHGGVGANRVAARRRVWSRRWADT